MTETNNVREPDEPEYTSSGLLAGDRGINQPWYGIGFGAAIRRFFKKYMRIQGRASRGEFWWVALLLFAVDAVLVFVLAVFGMRPTAVLASSDKQGNTVGTSPALSMNTFGFAVTVVILLFTLATIVPFFSIAIRRLHDANKPTGWIAPLTIAVVGVIAVLYIPLPAIAVILVGLLAAICVIWFLIIMVGKPFVYKNRWDLPEDDPATVKTVSDVTVSDRQSSEAIKRFSAAEQLRQAQLARQSETQDEE